MRAFCLCLLVFAAGFESLAFAADTDPIIEGRQYAKVPLPSVQSDTTKIVVEEFFWYGCPHCFRLESELEPWLSRLPADVLFTRVPDSLGRDIGRVHQQAFYIARRMGIEAQIHRPLMDALVNQMIPLNTLPLIRGFFIVTAGVKPAAFDAAAQSFMIEADVTNADQLERNYQVTTVPTMIVGGEYRTDHGQPGIYDARMSEAELNTKMLAVVDALIDKVRAERRAAP